MKNEVFAESFGNLDTCAVFQCSYTLDEFIAMRNNGYTGVIFGYLDANWDGDFSRLDNYAYTSVFSDMIPSEFIKKNRIELARRLECAKEAGLKVWMSVRGPLTGSDLYAIDPEKEEKYHHYFGPGGDKWGGSGKKPMCLFYPEVKRRYQELIRDAVASFPGIDGFVFFGGDSYSLVCDETCPRCNVKPCWKNWSDWIAGLKNEAEKVRQDVEFTIMNWPWWDDMFAMAEDAPIDIGFLVVSNWGASYGGYGERYPAAIEPWECQEFQVDTLRVPVNHEHQTAYELTQPWINAPVTDKFKRLAKICREQGRKFYAWCDLTTSEAVLPYFTPFPATTLSRLRSFRDVEADGIVDFWGIPKPNLQGELTDANTVLLKLFLANSQETDDALLEKTARFLYGAGSEKEAVKAWHLIDEALAKWPIVGYSQRMHWVCRRLWEKENQLFYVFNLTLPYIKKGQPVNSSWPAFLYNSKVWENMKVYLNEVIDCYDRALACYDRICMTALGTGEKTAQFHRDCATLTRCYFQIALESCDYHIAGLAGKTLSREYIRRAAITRRLCRTLYVALNVTPYENDMSEVLSQMSEY